MMNGLFLTLMLISQILPERIVVQPGDSVKVLSQRVVVKKISVIPPTLGYVKNCYFHARTPGEGVIKVELKNDKRIYSFVKVAKTIRSFRVNVVPENVKLGISDSLQFYVRLPRSVNEGQCFIRWHVIPAWIGKISLNGQFVAGNRIGRGKIVAIVKCRNRRGIGFSTVSVGENASLKKIKIVPDPVYITNREPVRLHIKPDVTGFDSLDWIVEPERIGFINEHQQFVPLVKRARGVVWFTGWKDSKAYVGKALVIIGSRESMIKIEKQIIKPGDSCRISANPPIRILRRLRRFELRNSLTWSVEPEWLGRFENPSGFPATIFIAGTKPGVGEIFLKINERELNISSTPIIVGKEELKITPQSVIMKLGEERKFSVEPRRPGVWHVVPSIAGEINGRGLFRAELPIRNVFIIYELKTPDGGGAIARVTILPEPENN